MPKPAKVGVGQVDFKPVDLSGLSVEDALRAIGEGMNAIHTCIHMGQEENRRAHDEARVKRHEMSSDITKLESTVQDLGQEIGGLKVDRDTTDGYIKRLAEKFGAVEIEHDHKKRAEPIGTWSWKKASIAGAVLIFITTIVTNAAVYAFFKTEFLAADDFLTKQAAQSQGQIVDAPEKKHHEK